MGHAGGASELDFVEISIEFKEIALTIAIWREAAKKMGSFCWHVEPIY